MATVPAAEFNSAIQQDVNNSGGFLDRLFNSSNISGMIGSGIDLAATNQAIDQARAIAPQALQTAQDIAGLAKESAAFQPFTITSSPALGSLSVGAQGDITMAPSQQQELMTQQALQGAQSVLGGLLTGTGQREQDIYGRIQAARQPQIDRDQAMLQQQMAAQGRLGLGSALYGGGSPEEFARQQALLEQQSKDYLTAMQGAQGEVTSQSNLLGTLTGQAYQPQSQMLSALQASTPIQQAVGAGRLSGSEALQTAISPVLNSQVAAEREASNLYQTYMNTLSGMFAPTVNAATGVATQSGLGSMVGDAVSEGLQTLYNKIF
jgi:hypothetical protein